MGNILISAAREYVTNIAKIDKEFGASEKETRETTPIAYQAFIAGAKWVSQNKVKHKIMCLRDKTKICNLCHECDVDVLNPNY